MSHVRADVRADIAASRAATMRGTLLELVRMQAAQQEELATQRYVLHELSSVLAQLLHCWNHNTRKTLGYRSLEELLRLQSELRHCGVAPKKCHDGKTGDTSAPGAASDAPCSHTDNHLADLAEIETLVEERVLDADGLPVDHPLVFGSLSVWGLAQLLPVLQRWVHWVSERVPALLSLCGGDAVPDVVAEPLPCCLGKPPLSPHAALRAVCAGFAHVLDYWRLACSTPSSSSASPLLAQLLVRGPGACVEDPRLPGVDLRSLRAGMRFLLVDMEEIRDVFDSAAVGRRLSGTGAVTAGQFADLAVATHKAIRRIRKTVPGL